METLQSVSLVNKLRGLSQEGLEEILNSAEQQEAMTLDSEEVQNLQLEREMFLAANRSLAEENLELQPRLEESKGRLQDKYQQLQSLYDTVQEHKRMLERFSNVTQPDSLLSILQAEGAKIEESSEEMAEKFLEGQFALDAFLEQYKERRTTAHLRRIQIEKLQEILNRPQPPPPPASPPLVAVTPEPLPEAPKVPARPPPPAPLPLPGARPPSLPYNPNPGVPGVPHQVMAPYPSPPAHFYPRPPYPVLGQFPAGQPPYPPYPMPAYSYDPSGPPQLPPRPGYRQPQPGYHMPQPF